MYSLCMHYTGRKYMHNQLLFILQKKAMGLIHFKESKSILPPLSKIIELPDKVRIDNCLFISTYINNKLPLNFNN